MTPRYSKLIERRGLQQERGIITIMQQKYYKGQIYYVASDMDRPPIGCEIWSDRPALIVSNNAANARSGIVQVVYLTTSFKKKASPTHINIQSGSKTAIALCEQIHAVDQSRIKNYIGEITSSEQKEIDQALMFNLAIDEHSYRGLFRKWENYIHEHGNAITHEQEYIREYSESQVIEVLRRQLKIAEKERDGYRSIAESKQARLDELIKIHNRVIPNIDATPTSHGTQKEIC